MVWPIAPALGTAPLQCEVRQLITQEQTRAGESARRACCTYDGASGCVHARGARRSANTDATDVGKIPGDVRNPPTPPHRQMTSVVGERNIGRSMRPRKPGVGGSSALMKTTSQSKLRGARLRILGFPGKNRSPIVSQALRQHVRPASRSYQSHLAPLSGERRILTRVDLV